VYDKKIITWSFSYQISHETLVLISAVVPLGFLVGMSRPRVDKGSDMKKSYVIISMY